MHKLPSFSLYFIISDSCHWLFLIDTLIVLPMLPIFALLFLFVRYYLFDKLIARFICLYLKMSITTCCFQTREVKKEEEVEERKVLIQSK